MNFLFTLFLLIFCIPLFTKAAELEISCPHGQILFQVELAQTPEELAKGLMHRETLEQDEGMLFHFPEPHPVAMWMKNTLLPLDMIFISPKGEILAIEENTTPRSLKVIGPIENTLQVLEIKGGTAKKHRISKACSVQSAVRPSDLQKK